MNEIFTKRGMKAGLLFGGIVVVLNLVLGLMNTFIPFLVCFTWVLYGLGWLILFVGGYVNGYAEGFTKETMTMNLKKAIGAGLWAALIMGVLGGLIAIVLSLFPRSVTYLGYSYTYTDFSVIGAIFSFFGQMASGLISGLFWFIVGGLIYAYYPVNKLPSNVASFVERLKSFVTR